MTERRFAPLHFRLSLAAAIALAFCLPGSPVDAGGTGIRANPLVAGYTEGNENWVHLEEGEASWYGPSFHGKQTAAGEVYDQNAMTAAHPWLPFNTRIRVTNKENGRSVVLRVNDRGPFKPGRIVDVSYRAAQELAMIGRGLTPVVVESAESAVRASGTPPLPAVANQPATAAYGPCGPNTPYKTTPHAAADGAPNVGFAANTAPYNADAPVVVASRQTGPMYVQVGAYQAHESARIVDANLRQLAPTMIEPVTHWDGRQLYRVRLGPFDTTNEADQVRELAHEAGFPDSKIIRD